MKIYDISRTITADMLVWKGHPPVEIRKMRRMTEGARNNLSYLGMTVHTGTHVDAPFHFLEDGSTTENLSLQTLLGPAAVVEVAAENGLVSRASLQESLPAGNVERILLKTAKASRAADGSVVQQNEMIALSADSAALLVDLGIRLVGIDTMSIASEAENVLTHQTLLKAGMIIVEGLDLGHVPPGNYDLCCLPLRIDGLDGAPARAVLLQK